MQVSSSPAVGSTRRSKAVEVLCIGLTLGSFLSIVMLARPWPPSVNRSLHRVIGTVLARQALALLGPGAQIGVISRDTDTFRQPALDALLNSFEQDVRRAGAKIAFIERVQLDPLRPVEVPAGDLYERLRRAPPGQVIVSLLGPPLLSEAQWRQLGVLKARLVAFCPGDTARNIDLQRLIEAGYLHAAVVSRSAPATGRGQKSARFEDLFLELTAANGSKLSATSRP